MFLTRRHKSVQLEVVFNNFFNLANQAQKGVNFYRTSYDYPNKLYINALGGQSLDTINLEATSTYLVTTKGVRLFSLTPNLVPHWTRFMFRGKAFRLRYYKRLNRFIFNLGYSHITKLWLSNIFLGARKPRPRERTRQRYAVFSYSLKQLIALKWWTVRVKPYNFYTQRGLRLRAQGIGRRFGKISQHISSLH